MSDLGQDSSLRFVVRLRLEDLEVLVDALDPDKASGVHLRVAAARCSRLRVRLSNLVDGVVNEKIS
jgi:hypothetical protein